MSWQSKLDPNSQAALRQKAERDALLNQRPVVQDPQMAERLAAINQRAPWLTPQQQIALARSYATDSAVDLAGQLQGREVVAQQQQPTEFVQKLGRVAQYGISSLATAARVAGKALDVVPGALEAVTASGNFLYDTVIDPLKPVTRYGVAALDAIPETVQNVASMFVATKSSNRTLGGFWDSLSIATLLDEPDLQGEGFVVGDDFRAEQARRAREFRGELNGSAFTLGRGAANIFFTPNSEGYNNVSGFIDAMVLLLAPDPTKPLSKGAKLLAKSGGEVPILAATDPAALRAALKSDAGITDNIINGSIDLNKWNKFMDTHPTARKIIDEVTASDDELDIMENVFNYDISPDMAYSLANAKTRDEVKAILSEGWVLGEGTLSTSIYDYRNPLATRFERAPLINSVRKSRLFRQIPDQYIVINGDRFDRTKAVKNMVNSARAAGATEDEVRALSKQIVPAFRGSSTADDQYDAYRAYEATLTLILRKNGLPDGVIQRVLEKPKGEMDRLRKYMTDRAGNETDHGSMNTLMEMIKEDLPEEFYTDFLERAGAMGDSVGFDRPMQIVELLNRVQTLPDPRELRRITRNSFFAELMQKENPFLVKRKGGPLGAFGVSKREKFEAITDPKRYDEIESEIQRIVSVPDAGKDKAAQTRVKELLDEQASLITERRYATGEQKFIYEFLDTLQGAIWKPLTLATGGYVVRNSIDAQIRMHFGANTGIFHPWEYVNLIAGRKKRRSILGDDLVGKDITALRKEHAEFLSTSARRQGMDVDYFAEHMRRTGAWASVTRQMGGGLHTDAMIQQGRLAFSDPLQSVAARGFALGKSEDEIVEMVLRFAKDKDNYDEIKGIYKRGATYVDINGTKVQAPSIDFDLMDSRRVDEYLRQHIKSVVLGNVKNNTGGIPEMQYMFGFNKVPIMELTTTRRKYELSSIAGGKEIAEGSLVKFDGGEAIVGRISGDDVTIIPVHEGEAFAGLKGSKQAKRLIEKQPLYNPDSGIGLPQSAAREVYQRSRGDAGWLGETRYQLDRATDWFFTQMYNDKYVKTLEKSPVVRKFYYETISENINRLDSKSAKEVLSRLRAGAKEEGVSIGKYIGDEKTAAKIEEIAKSGVKGTATAQDLDDYARFIALQKTKRLLYDAADRNNLEDIIRAVAPFAVAWREILGTYGTLGATENVRMMRSFQRVYTGAKYADPDNDGRGFFYEDPQTGRLMFAFPASGAIMKAVQNVTPGGGEPVRAILEAPVKQLSQGINVFPALGPMAQVVASEIIPDVPAWNNITEVLLPFGKKGPGSVFNVTPGWLQKMEQALRADTRNTTTAYFNTYTEVLRAKAATGDYDLSREDEKERLLQDAKYDARWLTALRSVSQFFGPTAGTTEFIVDTKQGDVFVGEMIKEFQDMQRDDYDTAVPRFLDLYGENMSLYLASKSRSVVNGLETSEEFGAWTQENEGLIDRYPEVAAYFAPKGSDFNFAVWRRQLEVGYRENLTGEEMLTLAQERIGAAKFRAARKLFGAYPTQRQREILSVYRERLHERYPGFPRFAEFVTNQFENNIFQLEELISNPRVQDSPVTPALKDYLDKRASTLQQIGARTFRAKGTTRARAYMYRYGEELARQNPEFDRIWSRLLAQEVDE